MLRIALGSSGSRMRSPAGGLQVQGKTGFSDAFVSEAPDGICWSQVIPENNKVPHLTSGETYSISSGGKGGFHSNVREVFEGSTSCQFRYLGERATFGLRWA